MTDNILTPEFRVSFPYLFRPSKPMQDGGVPKFTITMLFPKDADLSALKAAAENALHERWGTDPKKWPNNLRSPFHDQGEKDFEGYEEGAKFITATSIQRPGLVDAQVQAIIDESEFYPGCYARATVRAFAYPKPGQTGMTPGVAFGLQNVQKTRDGDSLGGRTRPQDDFAPAGDPTQKSAASSVFDD